MKKILIILILLIAISQPLFAESKSQDFINVEEDVAIIQRLHEESVAKYKKLLEIDPKREDAYLGLAKLHQYRGMYDEAINFYKEVIALNPENILAFFELGECYLQKGWSDGKAARAFNQAFRLAEIKQDKNFKFDQAYYKLGKAYHQDYYERDKAIENFKKAIAINQQFPDVHYSLGLTYYYQDNMLDSAKAEFETELLLNDEHEDSNFYLGLVYNDERQIEKAINQIQKVVQINPNNGKAYEWLGYLYKEDNQLKPAIEHYKKAAELDSKDSRYSLAKIYFENEEYDETINQLKILIELEPDNEEYLDLIVDSYQAQNNFIEARIILKKIKPYSHKKLIVFLVLIFLPAFIIFGLGRWSLKKIIKKKGEERIAQYHRFNLWTGKIQFAGIVLLIVMYYVLHINYFEEAYNLKTFMGYVLFLTVLTSYFLTGIVFINFDRIARQTKANLKEYLRIYIGTVIIFSLQIIVLIHVVFRFPKATGNLTHTTVSIVLLAVICYGYPLLVPYLFKIYRLKPIKDENLKNRLLNFCKKTNVYIRDIFIIETSGIRVANAAATGFWRRDKNIYLTSYLLETLTKEEIDAIFLHELGHIKKNHIKIQTHLLFLCLLFVGLSFSLPNEILSAIAWPVILVCYFYLRKIVSMRHEREADEFAVDNSADPECKISALRKIYSSSYIPKRWSAPLHPSLAKRIDYIKKRIRIKKSSEDV